VIANRLCLACGQPLRGLPVDRELSGRRPVCDREYHLGEYVHPNLPDEFLMDTAPAYGGGEEIERRWD
jgi:hypothetical protein